MGHSLDIRGSGWGGGGLDTILMSMILPEIFHAAALCMQIEALKQTESKRIVSYIQCIQ
jgi:hypothetical protein